MILWSSEAEGRRRELDEGGQNMHTSSYKVIKSTIDMKVIKRLDPKSFYHKPKYFLYPYDMMDVKYIYCGNHFLIL